MRKAFAAPPRRLCATAVWLCAVVAGCDSSSPYAHLESGPPLLTPVTELDAAIDHIAPDAPNEYEPILLVHGTGSTPEESWGWTYARVLPQLGFDVYTVRLPDRSMGDLQDSTEYVVHAIRHVRKQSGRKVDVIGHSQGGVLPRWALKWWPDIRESVDDLVTLASPRDGTLLGTALCTTGCGAAVWQVSYLSQFVQASNRGGSTPGEDVSYTTILTLTDEIALPGVGLGPAANAVDVFVQDLCPARPVDHISMVADAAAFDAALDALTHPGGFDSARFDDASCAHLTMPGVAETELVTEGGPAAANAALAIATATPRLFSEPQLRSYVKYD